MPVPEHGTDAGRPRRKRGRASRLSAFFSTGELQAAPVDLPARSGDPGLTIRVTRGRAAAILVAAIAAAAWMGVRARAVPRGPAVALAASLCGFILLWAFAGSREARDKPGP